MTKFTFFDFSLLIYLIFFVLEKGEYSLIEVGRWGATALVIISGFGIFVKNVKSFKLTESFIWYFLFAIYALISSHWALNSGAVFELLITFIRILFILFFISLRIERNSDIRLLLRLYAYAIFFRVIVVLMLMIGKVSLSGVALYRFGDIVGYNPNSTAMYCVLAIYVIVDEFRCMNKNKINIVILFVLFGAVLLTGSKKGILGLLVGFSLYLFFNSRGTKKIVALPIISIVLLGAYEAITTVPSLYISIGYRFEQMFDSFNGLDAGTSTIERMSLIEEGILIWKDHKLLGVGLNNFSLVQKAWLLSTKTYAHCNYVELLADLGVVGVILYYIYPLKVCFKYKISSNIMLTLKTLTILILLFDTASVSYNDIFIILILGLSFFAYKEQKNNGDIYILIKHRKDKHETTKILN